MIQFRPHHFLCTLGFQGKGYSPEFVANYTEIVSSLSDSTEIEVVERTDDICRPCPSRRGSLCETQNKIEKLDQAHAGTLGLQSGDRLTWGDAKILISDKMTIEKFHQSCEPCSWRALGVCEASLRRLQESTSVSP